MARKKVAQELCMLCCNETCTCETLSITKVLQERYEGEQDENQQAQPG